MPRPFPIPQPAPARVQLPYLGLNARDNIALLNPQESPSMLNVVPGIGSITTRLGWKIHSNLLTGVGSGFKSETILLPWRGGATEKLFVCTSDLNDAVYDVYEVTGGTPVVQTGITFSGGDIHHTMFGTPGGSFMIVCDNSGLNHPRNYNGTTWAQTPAITGVTAADLCFPLVFKNRLFFIQRGTLSVWYLPVVAIGGAASQLDLSTIASLGGSLLSLGRLSTSSGEGLDDFWIAVTSKGEVIVFGGTDPASAATWSLEGVYRIPQPIGRRCLFGAGGELYALTIDGIYPIRPLIAQGHDSLELHPITKVNKAFRDNARLYFNSRFFMGGLMPIVDAVFFNIPGGNMQPVAGSPSSDPFMAAQYVFIPSLQAWTKFDFPASDWAEANGAMFFGGRGIVGIALADLTRNKINDDNGSPIPFHFNTAFTDGGIQGVKRATSAILHFKASNQGPADLYFNTNYSIAPIPAGRKLGGQFGGSSTPWGSPWGSSWGGTGQSQRKRFYDLEAEGQSFSTRVEGNVKEEVEFNGLEVYSEVGNYF